MSKPAEPFFSVTREDIARRLHEEQARLMAVYGGAPVAPQWEDLDESQRKALVMASSNVVVDAICRTTNEEMSRLQEQLVLDNDEIEEANARLQDLLRRDSNKSLEREEIELLRRIMDLTARMVTWALHDEATVNNPITQSAYATMLEWKERFGPVVAAEFEAEWDAAKALEGA